VVPENSHLFAAMGAALMSGDTHAVSISDLISSLEQSVSMPFELKRMEPLFRDEKEYDAFCCRHEKARVKKQALETYSGSCYLGIDAGSTTTKLALIGDEGQLLWSYYANNQGSPIKTAIDAIAQLSSYMPQNASIVQSCATGYGEALLKTAF